MIPHEPWLVILSIAIAIQGSFVGLSLARGLDSAEGFHRRLALAGSAITLATGVWSMHFVAMLAANFPSAVDYLVLPTLLSFLICVIVVGIGVYAAHASGPPALRIGRGAPRERKPPEAAAGPGPGGILPPPPRRKPPEAAGGPLCGNNACCSENRSPGRISTMFILRRRSWPGEMTAQQGCGEYQEYSQ